MKKKIWLNCCLFCCLVVPIESCGVYSFTDTAIPPEVKTASVKDFQNAAANGLPRLGLNLTEQLKNKLQAEPRLRLIRDNGDARFSGAIIGYDVTPAASGGGDQAQLNRLTITVRVEYVNIKTKTNWSQTFKQFENFDRNKNISDVEESLTTVMVERLVDEIFNRAFSNW